MADHNKVVDVVTKHFRERTARDNWRRTIDEMQELPTHWLVRYSMENLDHPDEMLIVNCWLMLDLNAGCIYVPRTRFARTDVESFPQNRSIVPSDDIRHLL